jgi:hypothetical protein
MHRAHAVPRQLPGHSALFGEGVVRRIKDLGHLINREEDISAW